MVKPSADVFGKEKEGPSLEGAPLSERKLKLKKLFRRIPKAAAFIIILLLLCAIFSPWIAPHDPIEQNLVDALKPPFWQKGGMTKYLLGTDNLGRDILSRIVYGAR